MIPDSEVLMILGWNLSERDKLPITFVRKIFTFGIYVIRSRSLSTAIFCKLQ
jgi:hypothetical protein